MACTSRCFFLALGLVLALSTPSRAQQPQVEWAAHTVPVQAALATSPPLANAPDQASVTTGPSGASRVPGLQGSGRIPGPRSLLEGLISVLGPAALGLLGGWYSGLLGGREVPVQEGRMPRSSVPPLGEGEPTRRRRTASGQKVKKEEGEGGEKAQEAASSAGGAIGLLGRTLSSVQTDLEEAAKTIGPTLVTVGGAEVEGARQLAREPVWDVVTEWTHIDNLGNAIDPTRSLLDRVGQVGVAVSQLSGLITATSVIAMKVKRGASAVVEGERSRDHARLPRRDEPPSQGR